MRIDIDIMNIDFDKFIEACCYDGIYVEPTDVGLIFYPQHNIEVDCFVEDSNFSCNDPIVNFNKEFGFEYHIPYDVEDCKYKLYGEHYPNQSLFPIIWAILNHVNVVCENNNHIIELDNLSKLHSVIEIGSNYKNDIEYVNVIMDYDDIDEWINESFYN